MNFRKIAMSDKEKIERFFVNNELYSDYEASELNFTNIFAWSHIDDIEIAEGENWILLRGQEGIDQYFLPPLALNKEGLEIVSQKFRKYCDEHHIYPILRGLNEKMKNYIMKECEHCFEFISYRNYDVDEYLYLSENLINLTGKKYSVKRNHLNKFLKTYPNFQERDYHFSDFPRIKEALDTWTSGKTLEMEKEAISHVLNHLQELDAFCNLIEVDHVLVAFAIGTITKNHVGLVLFEKADLNYDGAYAAINQMTAKKYFQGVKFINRQEDMGIPNLKKAKMSYHPHHLAEKYSLIEKRIIEKLRLLYETNFPEDKEPSQYLDYYFQEKMNIHQVTFLVQERDVISALYCFPRTLKFNQFSLECPVISAAATLPKYQNQGYFRKLMMDTFTKLRMKMVPLVMLYPLNHEIYRHFGFGVMNYFSKLIPSNTHLEYQVATTADISLLLELYNLFMEKYHFYVARDESSFVSLFKELTAYGGKLEIIYKEAKPIGYVVTSLDNIEELILLENIYLEKYPSYLQTLPTTEVDILGNMVRIIFVEKVLEEYPYPAIIKKVKLKIADNLIEENNVIVEIDINQDNVTISEVETYDYVLDIMELSELIFTGKTTIKELQEVFVNSKTAIVDKY